MRKLLPLTLLLLAGCGYGPTRLKPGSDMAIPRKVGLTETLLRSLACSASARDSIQKTPAGLASTEIRTGCGALKDTIKR
jgi:hypothetical protein